MKLLMILLVLMVSLFIVVKVTERYGQPMSPARQAGLSNIIMVLVFVLILGQIIMHFIRS